ncbi:hypothetical protein B0G77_6627 [Paraburkholderia sp. BL10I2N1]|nr:hypothetical protein B0G77_6627 [Paraburkholderia sp. BL10I2N1]
MTSDDNRRRALDAGQHELKGEDNYYGASMTAAHTNPLASLRLGQMHCRRFHAL